MRVFVFSNKHLVSVWERRFNVGNGENLKKCFGPHLTHYLLDKPQKKELWGLVGKALDMFLFKGSAAKIKWSNVGGYDLWDGINENNNVDVYISRPTGWTGLCRGYDIQVESGDDGHLKDKKKWMNKSVPRWNDFSEESNGLPKIDETMLNKLNKNNGFIVAPTAYGFYGAAYKVPEDTFKMFERFVDQTIRSLRALIVMESRACFYMQGTVGGRGSKAFKDKWNEEFKDTVYIQWENNKCEVTNKPYAMSEEVDNFREPANKLKIATIYKRVSTAARIARVIANSPSVNREELNKTMLHRVLNKTLGCLGVVVQWASSSKSSFLFDHSLQRSKQNTINMGGGAQQKENEQINIGGSHSLTMSPYNTIAGYLMHKSEQYSPNVINGTTVGQALKELVTSLNNLQIILLGFVKNWGIQHTIDKTDESVKNSLERAKKSIEAYGDMYGWAPEPPK